MADTVETPTSWRILIVDDEPSAYEPCEAVLSTVPSYVVRAEQSPLRALVVAREWRPDVIILDISMEELRGIELARRLKADGCAADLMFVTSAGDIKTKEEGLELADQYLTKPYQSRELLARMRALLRRREQGAGRAEHAGDDAWPAIDLASRSVRLPNGKAATLTTTELKLLLALLAGKGEPVSTRRLLQAVWNQEVAPDDGEARNSPRVQANISRLRGKLERFPDQPEVIITVPRSGYCLRLKPERHD